MRTGLSLSHIIAGLSSQMSIILSLRNIRNVVFLGKDVYKNTKDYAK